LLITEKEIFLIGDPFSFSLVQVPEGIKTKKAELGGMEEGFLPPVGELNKLIEKQKIKKIGFFDNVRLTKCRMVKIQDPFLPIFLMPDKDRISILKGNASICEKILGESLSELESGCSEIYIRNIVDEKIYEFGGERRAFPTKVIFGENTSNPFALSNNRRLKEGDSIMFNFGIIRSGVGIEVARTYLWKTPAKFLEKTYDDITEIYEKFLSFISFGKMAKEIYNYVMEIIKEKGYQKNLMPPLNAPLALIGKGIKISKTSNFLIKPGTILFPQLSFYFPGKFGVKFQDVFVLEGKNFNLTNFLNKGEVNVLLSSNTV
jgi:Xaa-Pro aminopeptidase